MDAIRADQFPLILEYEALMQGKSTFPAFWDAKGGHRLFGYKLLFYLNCYLFGFSPKLETILAVSVYAVAVYFIVKSLSAELKLSGLWLGSIVVVSMAMAMMNGQIIRLSSFSLIAMRLMNFAGFAAAAFVTYKIISGQKIGGPKLKVFGLLIGTMVFVLLFGRGWGMAAIAALMGVTILHRLSLSNWMYFDLWKPYIPVLAIFGITAMIYFYNLQTEAGSGKRTFDIFGIISFYTSKHGSAISGIFNNQLLRNIPVAKVLSLIYLVTMIGATVWIMFRKQAMNKQEWIAMFLLYFSFLAAILVSIYRFDKLPYSPRHNMELSMGALGVLYWIFRILSSINHQRTMSFSMSLLGIFFIFFSGSSIYHKFTTAGSLKKNLSNIETRQYTALSEKKLGSFTRRQYIQMGCPVAPQKCKRALRIIKKRELSPNLEKPKVISPEK